MKKVLCLIVALLLAGSFALSETIDLSSMTDDELLTLKVLLDQTISDRGLIKEFKISSGLYIGGTDIKPGSYRLTMTKDNGTCEIRLFVDRNTMNGKGTLFNDVLFSHKSDESQTVTISIEEGNALWLDVDIGEITLTRTEMIG